MERRNKGFTLMELIVAVGLMAVMFTSLSVVFKQVTDLIRRSEAEIEIYQTFRLVSKIMKKDFEGIINYEEPVFYMRYDETGQYDHKEDLCGYLRLEHHTIGRGVPEEQRSMDNFSFLGTDANMVQMENYIVPSGSRYNNMSPYVKTTLKGTDLVEISYAVEDKDGQVPGSDNTFDKVQINKWKLLRYVRKVIPKEFVSDFEKNRGLYGIVFKGDVRFTALNGKGDDPLSIGMAVFNGRENDNRIFINDYSRISNITSTGRRDKMPPAIEKYGKREILAEGCTEFDIKYWYYRKDRPHDDWRGVPYNPAGNQDGNPGAGASEDPYLLLGHFYNGCPPNPACIPTPSNPRDDEDEFQHMNASAGAGNSCLFAGGNPANLRREPSHPNWWYMPRMIQIRMRLMDKYQIIEQEFYTRFFLPSCDPYPMTRLRR